VHFFYNVIVFGSFFFAKKTPHFKKKSYLCKMEKTGFIEIRISGTKGNHDLSPDNYDIRELIDLLEKAEGLLYLGDKKDRPLISYSVEEGSVKHIFKTSIQYIIAFNAIMGQVSQSQTIDFLDHKTAIAFENFQNIATKKDYTFGIKTSLEQTNEVKIDKTTRFHRTEAVWADAEFYFYGKITNAGGKGKANIHISTKETGTIIIQTPIDFLQNHEENLLYKSFGVRAVGKQHSETGEIDTSTLKFVDLVDYQTKYDEEYLEGLIDKASKNWMHIKDKDLWLQEIRGGYDA